MIGRLLVQNSLGTEPVLEIQPHYKNLGDLRVKTWINAMINTGFVALLKIVPKLDLG